MSDYYNYRNGLVDDLAARLWSGLPEAMRARKVQSVIAFLDAFDTALNSGRPSDLVIACGLSKHNPDVTLDELHQFIHLLATVAERNRDAHTQAQHTHSSNQPQP